MWGRATRVVWKRKSVLLLRMFLFYYIHNSSGKLFGHCEGWAQRLRKTHCPRPPELNGALGGSTEAAWGLIRQPQDLAHPSSCPVDQDTILGRRPWRLGGRRHLAERDVSQGACLGSGWVAGGTVLAGWGVGANLGRLEPAAELKRFGRKCRIARDDFCAVVKLPAITSTAGTDRPVGEIGELPGRIVKLADEGPGGAPAGTTDPGKCRWAPPAETTPGPTRPLLLTGRRKVRHGLAGFARLREDGIIDQAPLHLMQPVTRCHQGSHLHFPRTRQCCLQPQRDVSLHGRRRDQPL